MVNDDGRTLSPAPSFYEYEAFAQKDDTPTPVLVSIPHGGTDALDGIKDSDFSESRFCGFRFGYSDAYAPEIYGDLHRAGAHLITSRYSRLFVDLNRRRDAFEVVDGEVISKRGVFRTHTIHDSPVLTTPLTQAQARVRLERYYDPYHTRLDELVIRTRGTYGACVVLDCHTGSPRRLTGHEIVLGTGRMRYCDASLVDAVATTLKAAGFQCTVDLSGYAGGHVVRKHGTAGTPVQALQIEMNADLVMRCTRPEYSASRYAGHPPPHDVACIGRLAAVMAQVVTVASAHARSLTG